MLADFAYSEWQEGAKYGSISDTASRWRYQLPNRSALMNFTENPYHIEILYPQNRPLGLSPMFPRGRHGWLGSLQWLHHSLLPRRPLSWPSARHRATRQLSDLSWYTVSCLMIRRRLALNSGCAVTVVWLTISTTVAVQYLGASNMHVFRCIYCEDLR